MQIEVLNLGGIVTKLLIPNRLGCFTDVVLGFDDPIDYLTKNPPYFGCLIGRYGNRIAQGQFRLDGKKIQLNVNRSPNTLHGGMSGFDKKFWKVTSLPKKNSLKLELTSPNGDEGFPGNLKAEVLYTLTDDNEWKISYEASSDQPTPVNLTNHTYFNLSGMKNNTILDHKILIHADHITSVDQNLTPTGEIRNILSTEMDFTKFKAIGLDISKVQEGGGYDHNYVLNDFDKSLKHQATLHDPQGGIEMKIFTTEPGLQFYAGNFLKGNLIGKEGIIYEKNAGMCLETQHFPDSPNHPHFPNTILRPGEVYQSQTIYRFTSST